MVFVPCNPWNSEDFIEGPQRLLQRVKSQTGQSSTKVFFFLSDLCVSSGYPLFEKRLFFWLKKLDRHCIK